MICVVVADGSNVSKQLRPMPTTQMLRISSTPWLQNIFSQFFAIMDDSSETPVASASGDRKMMTIQIR